MGPKIQSTFADSKPADASPSKCPASAAHQDGPLGAQLSFSPADIARQRLALLQSFDQFKARRGAAKAAKIVGVSAPTISRWRNKLAAQGLAGLQPKPTGGIGQRTPFAKLRLAVAAASELERLKAATGSSHAAWLQFAGSPLCPPLIARHIRKTGQVPARFAAAADTPPEVPADFKLSMPKATP